jgi:hypothetical protein
MAAQAKQKLKINRVIVIVLILIAIFCGYLLFKAGGIGGGNSCSSLRGLYEKAKDTEDYKKVSEYYTRMAELGCD